MKLARNLLLNVRGSSRSGTSCLFNGVSLSTKPNTKLHPPPPKNSELNSKSIYPSSKKKLEGLFPQSTTSNIMSEASIKSKVCQEDHNDSNIQSNNSDSLVGLLGKCPKIKEKRPFTVSVEGNIGSGKSTFLKYFASVPDVTTYQEPLDQWTNLGGHNLLGKFYEDPKRWNFLFQSYVQLTRLNIHLQNSNPGVKLMERSFHNNRFCFVENAFKAGHLHDAEFQVICEYFDFFEKHLDIGIDLIVYLKTKPEIVYERMKKRDRSEEKGVSFEYLESVHDYYEKWLTDGIPRAAPAPVLTLNGDLEIDVMFEKYESLRPLILGQEKFEKSACL